MKLKQLGNNKTEIELNSNTTVFFSYETPVAAHISGKGYFKTEQKFSRKTSKHINQWLDGVSVEIKPQSFFNELAGN